MPLPRVDDLCKFASVRFQNVVVASLSINGRTSGQPEENIIPPPASLALRRHKKPSPNDDIKIVRETLHLFTSAYCEYCRQQCSVV